MKQADVKVGGTYSAKVSDKVVAVRIDAENPAGGWDATNLATTKKIHIKSAQRLRGRVRVPAAAKPLKDAAAEKARRDAIKSIDANLKEGGKASTTAATTPRRGKGGKKATTATPKAKKATRAQRGDDKAAPKRRGILDVAAEILAKAKEPMTTKAIVDHAIEKGLWKTTGKTPAATLYAAIIREIQKRGKDARFQKIDRGLFRARKGA
jgi:HB1, ASXL, restriction endonuclease HTH domain